MDLAFLTKKHTMFISLSKQNEKKNRANSYLKRIKTQTDMSYALLQQVNLNTCRPNEQN